ncbi:hypothetical protein V8C43DRAFT_273919 [Trichoderma afarasin]
MKLSKPLSPKEAFYCGGKPTAGASPLREKMGRGCISWPVQCWIRYTYNAHCHSVPSTEVVYKCELPLSSRLRKYMKRRSGYLMVNQIPCLSNKKQKQNKAKSKQISAGIKDTYYIHTYIRNSRTLINTT